MIFYHGTTKKKWRLIKKEGVLWGYNVHKNLDGTTYKGYRYTYLTPDIIIASDYGDMVLEVEYDPVGVDGTGTDNYGFDPPEGQICWQFSVFIPIPISKVKIINIMKKLINKHLSLPPYYDQNNEIHFTFNEKDLLALMEDVSKISWSAGSIAKYYEDRPKERPSHVKTHFRDWWNLKMSRSYKYKYNKETIIPKKNKKGRSILNYLMNIGKK